MTGEQKLFQIPTQEIYLGNSEESIDVGRLAVIGFVNQEFALPETYIVDGSEAKAWPILLLDVDAERGAGSADTEEHEVYRLVPDYAKGSGRWQLHRGWDTLVQYVNNEPQLWSGNEDAVFYTSPRAYEQRKLQLAVGFAMRQLNLSEQGLGHHSRFVSFPGELRHRES